MDSYYKYIDMNRCINYYATSRVKALWSPLCEKRGDSGESKVCQIIILCHACVWEERPECEK